MPKYDSHYLQDFTEAMALAASKDAKDQLWKDVKTPIIEDAPNQPQNC